MSDQIPARSGQPADLDVMHADDLLLDALGRGVAPVGDDEMAALLAAWHADLIADPDTVDLTGADPNAIGPTGADPTAELPTVPATSHRRVRAHRGWRQRGVRLGAAAAVLAAVAGGTSAAAASATPDSPLWPITRIVNPARAGTLGAEKALAQARQAIIDGRYPDAARLLDQASTLISRVRDPADVQRLRAELDTLRRALATATPATGATPAVPGTTPTPSPTPAPPGATGHGGAATPTPTSHPGLPLPSLPIPLPSGGLLPSLPIPLPSLPLIN
jgi:hypothetical protein